MDSSLPVIWAVGGAGQRRAFFTWGLNLQGKARLISLGPPGDPEPDLELGPQPDLALALDSCPPELRPSVCLNLADPPPDGLDCLPCPVLGLNGARGLEGSLPQDTLEAERFLLQIAHEGLKPAWLERVQVNLPLRDFLGRFRGLAGTSKLNFEIGLDAASLDSLGPADLAQAQKMLAGRRVTVHLPFMDLRPASLDAMVQKTAISRLAQACDWALQFGAIQAVTHSGFDDRTQPDIHAFADRFARALAPLAARLAQNGCRLILENTYEPSPEPLLAFHHALAKNDIEAGFCLDVGHALCFSATGLPEWWEALSPRLWEMHLHDNDGAADRHWPPGWGCIDWHYLKTALMELGRQPIITLEPHNEPHLWAFLRGLDRQWGKPWT